MVDADNPKGDQSENLILIADKEANNQLKLASVRLYERSLTFKFVYSILGLCFGLACVIFGVLLFLAGIAGSSTLIANMFEAKVEFSDAAPGAVLFVIGLFVVVVTRFKVVLESGLEGIIKSMEMVVPPQR
jgi:hypothetical protein